VVDSNYYQQENEETENEEKEEEVEITYLMSVLKLT